MTGAPWGLPCVLGMVAVALAFSACGGSTTAPASSPVPAERTATPVPMPSAAATMDPLGPRPVPEPAPPFVPPGAQVLEGPGGSKVWLLERHALPLVTLGVVVPYGSAAEPLEKGGLAFASADMLDEGAGDRDALAFSRAMNDLGARLASSADRDASSVSLQVLSTKLHQALALVADAIIRPRHEKKDWSRVLALWNNALKSRAHEPSDVARVVTSLVYYGEKHPYGHPPEGTLASSKRVQLGDISRWHKTIWRPDVATFVVVGDVKPDQIRFFLATAFAAWKAPAAKPPPVVEPEPTKTEAMRTFVVDRPEASQVVMSWARSGPKASDATYARLSMLNIVLGGTFTSRLNQNLREDHGWTYGARSRFNVQRGAGMFVARADVRADAIGAALRETRREIDKLAKEGVSEAEVDKLRALINGDAMATYGTAGRVAVSLAGNAALGLLPDQDAQDLASQRSASPKELSPLAAKYLDLSSATVVLVGPKDLATKALADNDLPKPELLDAEGARIAH